MMGDVEDDFVLHSSDSDDVDWTKYLGKHHLKKNNCFSSSSSTSSQSTSSTHADSVDENNHNTELQKTPKAPKHPPSKKRTVSESTISNTLNYKRNCPYAHLPMGNGFRHERVTNNTNNSDPNPGTSDMSWQGKHSDWNHSQSNHTPTNGSQPSGSCQDSSGRQSRYHSRPTRKTIILNSDSDEDDEWTERNSDNTTYRSHSNSPDHDVQQKSKKTSNPTRKSKTSYNSRPGRDSTNNNSCASQPSAGQTSKDGGSSKSANHHNHRLKRNTAVNGVTGAGPCSSNDDGNTQHPGQATPKNRHLHRLRMHQNRSSGASAYAGSSESESFNNLAFRRDDPGRRAFSRSGHPLHGRRSRGSPHHYHHRSPVLPGQESPFSRHLHRNPDLFESESTDDGCDLFPGGTNSLTRNGFRQTSPHHRNSFRYQTFGSTSLLENARDNSEDNEELGVVFLPENSLSPMSRNRRDQGRYSGVSGGRRRRSSRPSHLLTGEHNHLSSSPEPVSQVNQLEEDERFARLLQAEFDAELSHHRHSDIGSRVYHSESDVDIYVDEEEILSSLSSSSSNAEETSYAGRHRPRRAQFFFRHQMNQGGNVMGGAGLADPPPPRGRRRGGRVPTSTTPVVPPRHWHGSPVRGRRGRTRSSANSDPLMFQFGRWLGWALIRNLDAEDDYEVLWNLAESMGEAIPRGLQRHEINRLPTHTYQASAGTSDNASEAGSNNNIGKTETSFTEATKECRVCLCDYEANELLRVLPCFHEFHAACIDKWLKNNNTCPVCRAEITLNT